MDSSRSVTSVTRASDGCGEVLDLPTGLQEFVGDFESGKDGGALGLGHPRPVGPLNRVVHVLRARPCVCFAPLRPDPVSIAEDRHADRRRIIR